MSTQPPASHPRDLTLEDVARRLQWGAIAKVITSLVAIVGVVQGITAWALHRTHEAQLAQKQLEVDQLKGKLESADADKTALTSRVKTLETSVKRNDAKNKFLYLCLDYHSATERDKLQKAKQAETLLKKMYKEMYKDGVPNMEKDGFRIDKKPVGGGPPEGFITFAGDEDHAYPVPMGVKGSLLDALEHP